MAKTRNGGKGRVAAGPRQTSYFVRFPPVVTAALKSEAATYGISASALIRVIVSSAMAQKGEQTIKGLD